MEKHETLRPIIATGTADEIFKAIFGVSEACIAAAIVGARQPVPANSREAFEAWAGPLEFDLTRADLPKYAIYKWNNTAFASQGWQAGVAWAYGDRVDANSPPPDVIAYLQDCLAGALQMMEHGDQRIDDPDKAAEPEREVSPLEVISDPLFSLDYTKPQTLGGLLAINPEYQEPELADDEVTAELDRAGIDMEPANRRLRKIVAAANVRDDKAVDLERVANCDYCGRLIETDGETWRHVNANVDHLAVPWTANKPQTIGGLLREIREGAGKTIRDLAASMSGLGESDCDGFRGGEFARACDWICGVERDADWCAIDKGDIRKWLAALDASHRLNKALALAEKARGT